MPVICVHPGIPFYFLRRTSHLNSHRQYFTFQVPKKQGMDIVILVPFDILKIGGCCISIHHCLSVLVNDSSVIWYGSPTESPGHSTPLPGFPGQCDSPCYLFYQKFPICIHLSNATGGQFGQKRWLVALIFYNRSGV